MHYNLPDERLHRKGQTNSAEALLKTQNGRNRLNKHVYDALVFLGKGGAIPEDIANAYALDLIDVRRAFHVLKKKGLIVSTGTNRPNDKGNNCEVFAVAPQDRARP